MRTNMVVAGLAVIGAVVGCGREVQGDREASSSVGRSGGWTAETPPAKAPDLPDSDAVVLHNGRRTVVAGLKQVSKYAVGPTGDTAAVIGCDDKGRDVVVTLDRQGKATATKPLHKASLGKPDGYLVGVTAHGVVFDDKGGTFHAFYRGRKRKMQTLDLDSSGTYKVCAAAWDGASEQPIYLLWQVPSGKPICDLFEIDAIREFNDDPYSAHIVGSGRDYVVICNALDLGHLNLVWLPAPGRSRPVVKTLDIGYKGQLGFVYQCVQEAGAFHGMASTRDQAGKVLLIEFTAVIRDRNLVVTKQEVFEPTKATP